MTPAQLDLARRLASHPKWQWLPGLAACPWGDDRSERIHIATTPNGPTPCWGANEKQWYDLLPTAAPDLTDYATAAILLRMAMEAGRPPAPISRALGDDGEVFEIYDGTVAATALLAAWGEP